MLSVDQIRVIVEQIEYRSDWMFRIGHDKYEQNPFLQIQFFADGETQFCRKWQLSPHMVKSEIVRTAWKAVLAAEEHEAAERFRYKGEMIYNPHVDVDALVDFYKGGNLTARASNEKVVLIGDKRINLVIKGDTVSAEFLES
jgi:hypothetical protein